MKPVVNYLHKYYVDPKTKLPHPVLRIENAYSQPSPLCSPRLPLSLFSFSFRLVDLKYRVDPDISVDKQVAEIMRNMATVLAVLKRLFPALSL